MSRCGVLRGIRSELFDNLFEPISFEHGHHLFARIASRNVRTVVLDPPSRPHCHDGLNVGFDHWRYSVFVAINIEIQFHSLLTTRAAVKFSWVTNIEKRKPGKGLKMLIFKALRLDTGIVYTSKRSAEHSIQVSPQSRGRIRDRVHEPFHNVGTVM